jgi:hypothetical protein
LSLYEKEINPNFIGDICRLQDDFDLLVETFENDDPRNFSRTRVVERYYLEADNLVLILDTKEINVFDRIIGDEFKKWYKILFGNKVGWIKLHKSNIIFLTEKK